MPDINKYHGKKLAEKIDRKCSGVVTAILSRVDGEVTIEKVTFEGVP